MLMSSIPRLRISAGPALLSYGFRPFFLFGACYAALAILLWLPLFYGEFALPITFSPRDWHVHELLYGYIPAVVTGFLLTAIPNWTGRLPLQGGPLLVLVIVWAAGRVVVTLSAEVSWLAAALVDSGFLLLVIAATAREIIAGRNWRNLKILIPVAILGLGNAGFHAEAHLRGAADYSLRVGIAAVLVLMMLIGGRVIPSFTHNWLARNNPGRMPIPFAAFDATAIALSATALALWIVEPLGMATAAALFVAGLLQAVRLARWAGERTLRDSLVFVLHVAYAFVPVGFVLVAFGALGLIMPSAGLHAWMVGAAGMMTLAVMTRASLGHTGHELIASVQTQLIYASVFVAAVARICAALEPRWGQPMLHVAAFAWAAAFLGFSIVYGPMLWRARKT
jgi:uncharacterized protein involved in response to NO